MDCSTARESMLELVEGTLPPRVAAAVADHIKSCPSCMKELERQSSRTRTLQSLGRVTAPDQWDEISRSISASPPRRRFAKYVILAVTLCAATAAVTAYLLLKTPEAARAIGAASATPRMQSTATATP